MAKRLTDKTVAQHDAVGSNVIASGAKQTSWLARGFWVASLRSQLRKLILDKDRNIGLHLARPIHEGRAREAS